jgi:hypothetical protein
MTNEQITKAARAICSIQAERQTNDDSQRYLVGDLDRTVWMRLAEQGIRQGMEIERMGVVEWLLSYGERQTADSVKRADYIKKQSK